MYSTVQLLVWCVCVFVSGSHAHWALEPAMRAEVVVNASYMVNQWHLPRGLQVRGTCSSGEHDCPSLGVCCDNGWDCCSTAICSPSDGLCCNNGANGCAAGFACCKPNGCVPTSGAQCCSDGGYCLSPATCTDCDPPTSHKCCLSPNGTIYGESGSASGGASLPPPSTPPTLSSTSPSGSPPPSTSPPGSRPPSSSLSTPSIAPSSSSSAGGQTPTSPRTSSPRTSPSPGQTTGSGTAQPLPPHPGGLSHTTRVATVVSSGVTLTVTHYYGGSTKGIPGATGTRQVPAASSVGVSSSPGLAGSNGGGRLVGEAGWAAGVAVVGGMGVGIGWVW